MMRMSRKSIIIAYGVTVIILVIVVGVLLAVSNHKTQVATSTNAITGCRAKTLTVGNTGSCVKDIQIMTNYIETAGLTECTFAGKQMLPISGSYDSITQTQVKVVQTWANCYYKQEGMSLAISQTGNVDASTWNELCNLAYTSPKLSNASTSPYTQASITAGKDAHC
jgi:hypothetical protein